MSISGKVQQRYLEQDGEFWSAVFDVCRLVVPFDISSTGVQELVIDNDSGSAQRMRLVCRAPYAPMPVQAVVYYFESTLNFCYPSGNRIFGCEAHADPPIPLGYIDLQQMRMVLAYHLRYSGANSDAWEEQTERLFALWLGYLRRHYDRRLKGASLEIRLRLAAESCQKRYGDKLHRLHDLHLLDDTLTCNGRSVSRSFLEQTLDRKSGLEEIIAYLRLLQQQKRAEPRFIEQKTSLQPCFAYRKSGRIFTVYFDDEKKALSCRPGEPQVSLPFVIDADMASGNMTPPYEALYALTGGDASELEDLAKLVAYSLSAEKTFGGAVILSGELSFLMFYILSGCASEDMVRKHEIYSAFGLSYFGKSKAKDTLIDHKLSSAPFLLCADDELPIKPEGWQRLKKLMNGSTVAYRDSILREKKHRNAAQWLIAGDDRTATKLKRHGIPCLQPKFHDIADERLISLRSGWMSLILPLWGMMLLKRQTKAKASDDKPRGLDDFVRECCAISAKDGEFLPARTLYDAYTAHCGEYRRKPMLFKDFNDSLEKDFGLKRTRKHVTSGSNVTGYRRIRLVDEREPVDGDAIRYEEFCRMVESIRGEVVAAVEGFSEVIRIEQL